MLYATSTLWFFWVPGNEPNYLLHWLPGLVMSGVAVGLVLPSLSAAAVNRLPAEHYAVGSAVNQATRQIGSAIGVALTIALLSHPDLQRSDFNSFYLLHAALALATGLLCLPVDTRPRT
jgi:predicted MFS family arabinose efflux permease